MFVALADDRRRIVHVAVNAHPTAVWTARPLRHAFPDNQASGYLVHGRDSAVAAVAITLAHMNIDAGRTAPRSPWQNAYEERVIGSIARECLDHVTVLTRPAYGHVLTHRVAYYMRARMHLALAKDSPVDLPVRWTLLH